MTTTPVILAVPPQCTLTGCWSPAIGHLTDSRGHVAHYCVNHRQNVIDYRLGVYPPALSVEVLSLEVDTMSEVANVD